MNLDSFIFNLFNAPAGKFWLFDWLIIFFGQYLAYILVLGAIVLFFKEKNWRRQVYFFSLTSLSMILSRGIITELIGLIYDRPRPFVVMEVSQLINHSSDASFPSGHMAAFFALSLAVFYFNKKWGWWFLGGTTLMGMTRIMAGVHWPSDIIAGAILGLLCVVLVDKLFLKKIKNVSDSTLKWK